MDEKCLHSAFVKALEGIIPKKTVLADFISKTLCIEKETAYRRLRGEVHFSFREVGLLAEKLNISLDDLIIKNGSGLQKKMIMELPLNYLAGTYGQLQILDMVNYLEVFTREANSEYGAALSGIPFSLFLQYSFLARFFRLKYVNHAESTFACVPFEKIKESDAKIQYRNELYFLYRQISHTYYIWDRTIIPTLVNDIKYSNSIRLITDTELSELKRELHRFLDDLEYTASQGVFKETGNKFELYISDAHIDMTYAYMRSDKRNTSMLSSFILFFNTSEDKASFQKVNNWLKSLKRFSTLVSGIAERERIQFFEEQRSIVDTLDGEPLCE